MNNLYFLAVLKLPDSDYISYDKEIKKMSWH